MNIKAFLSLLNHLQNWFTEKLYNVMYMLYAQGLEYLSTLNPSSIQR